MAELALPDPAAAADLQTFAGRARRLDADAAIRLVARGSTLAVYASALHGPGTPTVLALRVLALAAGSDVDATVPAGALADRLARSAPAGEHVLLPLPPMAATGASWAGLLPPRSGWSVQGVLPASLLRAAARAGIDEVAAGTPAGAGAAAVAALRARVWGRPLAGSADVPAGAAFGAEAFGFLGPSGSAAGSASGSGADGPPPEDDVVSLHRVGPWWRLSTVRGHILTRRPPSL